MLLLGMMALPPLRAFVLRLAPWAALPAFIAVLALPANTAIELSWLFLGCALELDTLARGFLCFSAGLWLAAGVYARGFLESTGDPKVAPFFAWFLGTMGGNLLLIPAQDIITYISFFTVMSFCAYGLIIHERTAKNLFAGRLYIAMSVLGEIAAFGGLVWVCFLADGAVSFSAGVTGIEDAPHRGVILLLLFIGFGIKLGIMPLHVWLPLAHPAAPTPAHTVLSGVMIKTGLLLWMRMFPFEGIVMDWAGVLMTLGLFSAVAAALLGMTHKRPKVLLAYSSVSQMGLAATGVGIGLALAGQSEAVLTMLLIFAAHHAIAKGALFLGVGLAASDTTRWQRRILLAGLAIGGAALAGFPLTSGLAGKGYLKYLAAGLEEPWRSLLAWAIPLTSVTTMLLMIRYLVILTPHPKEPQGVWNARMFIPWTVLVTCVLIYPWLIFSMGWAGEKEIGLYSGGLLKALWPPLLAIFLAFALWKSRTVGKRLGKLEIPAGDIVGPALWVLAAIRDGFNRAMHYPPKMLQRIKTFLFAQGERFHGTTFDSMSRQESFALGMLLMTALALGMTFLL